MSLLGDLSVSAQIYTDSSKLECHSQLYVKKSFALNLESSAVIRLASGASDVAYSFQSVTAGKLLMICVYGTCTVKINGSGNTAITLKSVTNSEGLEVPGFVLLHGDLISSLHFGNAGLTAVDVTVSVAE